MQKRELLKRRSNLTRRHQRLRRAAAMAITPIANGRLPAQSFGQLDDRAPRVDEFRRFDA